MSKKHVALMLAIKMMTNPAIGFAAAVTIPGFYGQVQAPAINTLPVPQGTSFTGVTSITTDSSNNQMVINQNQQYATINWNSFNIGANATVYFSQKNAQGVAQPTWAALNRIYDQNPSLIYGSLKADGMVYLINRNGILFGPGSQVNVHAMAASALNIKDQDFTAGYLRFTTDDYTGQEATLGSDVTVANYGTITTDNNGFVALVAPQAVNGGTITSPFGKISLIGVAQAGPGQTDVEFIPGAVIGSPETVYNINAAPGIALNTETGSLIADAGRVAMHGSQVTQNGLIRAVSTVQVGGEIYLLATDSVTTGPTSLTSAAVTDSAEQVSQTYSYKGGTITIGGIYTSQDGTVEDYAPINGVPVKEIINNGAIEAPTGTVNLSASDRVYLESGSSISVAGLWVDEPASANQLEAQLNSVQLADFYNQKGGALQGQTITTTLQNGSSIGNISSSYTGADETAQERSATGGEINIGFGNINGVLGEFIAKQGASIDFSGGGFNYAAGIAPTSKLLSGTTVYDISNAPQNLSYQAILGNQTVTYAKYGIIQQFSGLYMGGGTPLYDYAPSLTVGSNAGSLSINARQTVLDCALNGSVTRGQYQTNTTSPTTNNGDDYAESVARGLEEPVGGTLTIGNNSSSQAYNIDFGTNAIVVQAATTPLPTSFGPNDPLEQQQTVLSATMLSNAGLSKLNLYANTSVTIDQGAKISLLAGGSYSDTNGNLVFSSAFTAKARQIVDQGQIIVPDGSVALTLQDNISEVPLLGSNANATANPLYVSSSILPSGILIDNGSVINVAGQTVDNSLAGSSQGSGVQYGHITGGDITIQDTTAYGTTNGNSVIVRQDAILDVSGGYSISTSGQVTGGNAGTLTLRGATLSVAGDIRGFSLPGNNGGTIILQAGEVVVAPQSADLPENISIDDPVPVQLQGILTLGENRLASTGFTQIELEAIHDVVFENGVTLAPSTVKSPVPVPINSTSSAPLTNSVSAPTAGGTLSPQYVGATSVNVAAGININTFGAPSDSFGDTNPIPTDQNARISVPVGTGIEVIPGGSITFNAPYIEMNGVLQALGGNISLTAGISDLDIGVSGRILAGGYNLPGSATVAGVPAGLSPQAGGSVTLTSTSGSIILESGSLVDVSGSPATQVVIAGADGNPLSLTTAGNAGSLTLNYSNNLTVNGEIDGQSRLAGVQGGTLTVNNTTGDMVISATGINLYQNSGFDAMTFKSPTSLDFNGSMNISIARSLTLDAPTITGTGYDGIMLSAPWLTLTNTSPFSAVIANRSAGNATLTLSGDWLDVTGSSVLSGFSDVVLKSNQDIRLSDLNYPGSVSAFNWQGQLATAGNLTMQAARIYPTTATDFTITTDGNFTVLPGQVASATQIYSAGGSLTINAGGGIDQEGVLAAPMGTISLNATAGRVFLADGSVTTTGSGVAVNYGTFDGTNWYLNDKNNSGTVPITAAPDSSITINGAEVVVTSGAKLDISGGGSVYSYFYQPDVEGTTNPISTVGISALTGLQTRPNRYVILPDNSVQIPGFTYTGANGKTQVAGAIYLNAMQLDNGTWLKAGTYSLLPAQFAFLPGALIISDTGMRVAAGSQQRTADGYQIDAGYMTYLGTGIKSQVTEGYEIQSAANVLQEGNFTVKSFTAGNAGSLSISGASTVMAGSINAAPLTGFNQGSLSLSSAVITVQEDVIDLPTGFNFTTPLPDSFIGQLQVAASKLSGAGLGTLTLGNEQTTTSVTVTSGSALNVPNIILTAANSVTIEGEAQVNGISQSAGGTVTMSVPTGLIDIQANALVHASNTLSLNASDFNLLGGLVTDQGSMNLTAGEIFFVPDSFTKSKPGLYLTENLWSSFAGYNQVTLASGSDLNFQQDVNMTVGGALTLNAGQFTGPANVTFQAGNISLLNSTGYAGSTAASTSGSLTLTANNGIQSQGNISFNGFATVNLNSGSDLTLQGAGSLNTGGDLNMTAARVTTSYFRNANNTYNAADFTITAAGAVNIMNSGGTAGTGVTPGGSLAITGSSITQSGIIEVASGQVNLTATSGDISLTGNAQILAQGSKQATSGTATTGEYAYTPGGQIALSSANGNINLANGSVLDVSAMEQGDAGSINLFAPTGAVTLNGALKGNAIAGKGGSLSLDTDAPSLDLTALAANLAAGGFTEQINIRARQGDLTLAQGQTMSADEIVLEADGTDGKGSLVAGTGNIYVNGAITATDGTNGGSVELYAQNNLTVNGSIQATGTVGGQVFLGSEGASGMVTLAQNGVIDVSGTSGTGGSVTFRAQQNGTGVNITMPGQINGASQVVAEAFKVYNYNSNYTISTADETTWMNDAGNYMANVVMPAGWGSSPGTQYHFRPGIEVQSAGSITLPTTLDLTGDRFGSALEPGVLTLRAAGDLNINADLVDHPTSSATIYSSNDSYNNIQRSWGFNLIAGADLAAASPLAVNTTKTGDLTIAGGNLVYTEDATINFASANNTNINTGSAAGYMINTSMLYSLASYGGSIRGTVGNDLVFTNGGAIQTATGNIDITTGGDLDLYDGSTLGAIRTTGEYAQGASVESGPGSGVYRQALITDYWTYQNGGNISLNVGGDVAGYVNINSTTWDYYYGGGKIGRTNLNNYLAASFEGANSTEGIATMGGGDITVRAGGSFTSQIGTFGTSNPGNLTIVAGVDLEGRFRVMNGAATLTSGGNFGDQNDQQVIELGNAQFSVSAQGDVYLGAVLNPANSRSNLFSGGTQPQWNLPSGYMDSSLAVTSLAGNLSFSGLDNFSGYPVSPRLLILPPSVSLTAAGDIQLMNEFYIAPSATGNLQMFAGGSIYGNKTGTSEFASIVMSDQAPATFYGLQQNPSAVSFVGDDPTLKSLVHTGDTTPIEVVAGVDIQDLQLYLPKQAEISAGQDIHNLIYVGQNIASTDLSTITAGRDIYYDMVGTASDAGYSYTYGNFNLVNIKYGVIEQGGPGALMVLAGSNIYLGTTAGIQSVGNADNPLLSSTTASDVIVAVGAKNALQATAEGVSSVQAFFDDDGPNGLQAAGTDYSSLQAEGNTAAAQQIIIQARNGIIRTLFDAPPSDGSGTLSMTQSQISTANGKGDIYLVTSGDLNVGTSALSSNVNVGTSGIYTSGGGAINIFSGGNINVNESRVMTFLGGDITTWSDQGNINAGRGSRTAVNPGKQIPIIENNPVTNQPEVVGYRYEPPAVGSGIRAVTSDPGDGTIPPNPGNIYLFAPQGVIDAGEAGIAGGKVILGATQVLNAQNISFSAGSVGVPAAATSSVSLGSLAGAGSVAETGKMVAQSSSLGANDQLTQQTNLVDQFLSKFLDVKVINFDTDEGNTDNNTQDEEKRKKK